MTRVWEVRLLLWLMVFGCAFNVGLALFNTWWSAIPALACFAMAVVGYRTLKREKAIAHTFDM